MIVRPYKRKHTFKRIAYVDADGLYWDENGDTINPLEIEGDTRCFCSWETARKLTIEGVGESLLWNGEHIRWRPVQRAGELEWYPRPYDAYVLRIPLHEEAETNVSELGRWRDWLYDYRAIPGTMGGTSMSLLKTQLSRPLYCSTHWDRSRLRQSAGGRIANGPGGVGEYRGQLLHWDLPAAYANEIGHLRYGGHWWDERNLTHHWLTHLVSRGVPVLVRARIYVPKRLPYGPVPTRPRGLIHPFKALMLMFSGQRYPVGKSVQGIWTYEEVNAALMAGCSVTIIQAWKHSSPKQSPFRHWWQAIQTGRDMGGIAGMLAKTTGNALWGVFALDPEIRGHRTIHYRPKGKRKMQVRKPRPRGSQMPAIDLAEIVAGRVRAKLYLAMLHCGADLVCAHTDGLWANGTKLSDEWQIKGVARRMELLSPQAYRYHPLGGGEPVVIYAGVPLEQSATAFDKAWSKWNETQTATA